MGAENLPEWALSRKPLFTEEVAEYTNFSVNEIRAMRKEGILKAILGRRPYRFDPVHIYQVFFATPTAPVKKEPEVRSLKIEDGNSRSHKPVTRKDLWL